MNSGCLGAGLLETGPCYSEKFILHGSLLALFLRSWAAVTIKEMTFLLPFSNTFVFLVMGWGWIFNGEIAGT
jgi:hypothetical protein